MSGAVARPSTPRARNGRAVTVSAAGTLLETFLTLALVCGVAFVVLYFAKRAGIARAFGGVELVGQLSLEPRRAIYLVRLGGKVLVIGASEAGLTKLGEVEATELPAAGPPPQRFGDVLARALTRTPAAGAAPAEAHAPETRDERPGDEGGA
jgi:flagellar protein FliO/FliZ